VGSVAGGWPLRLRPSYSAHKARSPCPASLGRAPAAPIALRQALRRRAKSKGSLPPVLPQVCHWKWKSSLEPSLTIWFFGERGGTRTHDPLIKSLRRAKGQIKSECQREIAACWSRMREERIKLINQPA